MNTIDPADTLLDAVRAALAGDGVAREWLRMVAPDYELDRSLRTADELDHYLETLDDLAHAPNWRIDMPTVSEIYPSEFLKSSDFTGRGAVELRIAEVLIQPFVDERTGQPKRKIVFALARPDGTHIQKKLVVNKTNAVNLSSALGEEVVAWAGHAIILTAGVARNGAATIVCTAAPSERLSIPVGDTDTSF